MNESRNDMAVLKIEVIVGTVDICGDYTGEHTTILLMVCPTVPEEHREEEGREGGGGVGGRGEGGGERERESMIISVLIQK